MDSQKDERQLQYQGLCPECQTGVVHLQYLTYFTWLNEELITVPNFPAWVCDVCGKRVASGLCARRFREGEAPAGPT